MTAENETVFNRENQRLLYILPSHGSWWVWLATTLLLAAGVSGIPSAFLAAVALTTGQAVFYFNREQSIGAFPVQLRLAYLALLCICYIPQLRWLYWLPLVGTTLLLVFGYCLLARCLSLLSWNRNEPLSLDLLKRTFLSRPVLPERSAAGQRGCAGGLCTIEAQVRPKEPAR